MSMLHPSTCAVDADDLRVSLLDNYLNRLFLAEAQRFPLFTEAKGAWKYSRGGSWVGGLWAGLWAQLGLVLNKSDYVERSLLIGERLYAKLSEDSAHTAMIFWYGAGYPKILLPNRPFEKLALRGARALQQRFDASMQCVPLGTGMAAGKAGKRKLSADSLAALVSLLAHYGDANLAQTHLETYCQHCLFDSGACVPEAEFKLATQWSFKCVPGGWSRGQAWSALGLVSAACDIDTHYGVFADKALQYWWQQNINGVKMHKALPSDFDPSACLIALSAAYGLAKVEGFQRWRHQADQVMAVLLSCEELWEVGEASEGLRFLSTPLNAKQGCRSETVWGYYFLCEVFQHRRL